MNIKNKFIPIFEPYLQGNEKKYLNICLKTNWISSQGEFIKKFERSLAKYHKAKYCIATSSCTTALHLSLLSLGVDKNSEVICPALSFIAPANMILLTGAKLVLVDIDPVSLTIDPNLIERKITRKTKAIMVVHQFGHAAHMNEIMKIAKDYNLKVVEDNAECVMGKYKNRMVGSIGDVSIFSMQRSKHLTTGDGGVILTNDKEIAVDLRSLMNHGRDGIYISASDDKGLTGKELEEVVSRRFSFIHVGHSFRCTEMEAAIGVGQLKRHKQIVDRRKEIAELFTESLSIYGDELQLPVCPKNRTHSYMLYGLMMKKKDH